MRWIRKNKSQSAAAVAVGIGALVMAYAVAVLLFGGSTATATSDRPAADPTLEAPLYVEPEAVSTTGTPTTPTTAPGGLPSASGSSLNPDGLSGNGGIIGLPKHVIVMRMTSSAPIPYVGYIVPTSQDDSTGTVKDPGTSWSHTAIGYGRPDYAQLFSLSGPTGIPITCTITVDGKVTEQRTTSGPYDQMFCQG